MPRVARSRAKVSARWFVYIVRCCDGSLYTGCTNDLASRVLRHNAGKGARYTRSRLPVRLVFKRAVPDRGAALRTEAALKKLSRLEKLALVRSATARRAGSSAGVPRKRSDPPQRRPVPTRGPKQKARRR